jgi:biopolymer transport protein ExbD
MGAAIGTDDKRSVNVELNIVPFIDLMSCLTAFLLVTAVWINIAQINIAPKGKSRDQQLTPEDDLPRLSVLVEYEKITVGVSRILEFQYIDRGAQGHDWDKLKTTLEEHKKSAFFADRKDIEIAAGSTQNGVVNYQDIIKAMDIALQAEFEDVGLTDPQGLSAKPQM